MSPKVRVGRGPAAPPDPPEPTREEEDAAAEAAYDAALQLARSPLPELEPGDLERFNLA